MAKKDKNKKTKKPNPQPFCGELQVRVARTRKSPRRRWREASAVRGQHGPGVLGPGVPGSVVQDAALLRGGAWRGRCPVTCTARRLACRGVVCRRRLLRQTLGTLSFLGAQSGAGKAAPGVTRKVIVATIEKGRRIRSHASESVRLLAGKGSRCHPGWERPSWAVAAGGRGGQWLSKRSAARGLPRHVLETERSPAVCALTSLHRVQDAG